jgi:murein DD-endopeptidase MepM/ murein hydrolase activator NlpD
VAAVPVDSPSSTTSLTVAAIEAEAARTAYVGRRRASVPASPEVETHQAEVTSDDNVARVLESLEPVDQTTGFEHEETARLTIGRPQPEAEPEAEIEIEAETEPATATYVNDRQVQPGKRRAVKHAGSRGPLFKALPSTPVLLGIAALAVSVGGVLTVPDQAPVSAAAGGLTHASALSGSSNVGKVVGERDDVVSRDGAERARAEAAGVEDLQAAVEVMAQQREGALAKDAAAAEKQAAKIALNLWQYPLASVQLTATFGQYGLWSSYHTGLDFNGDTGDSIYAIANGVVTSASYDGAYGNKTVVTLEDGTEIWYCHQTSFNVSVGDVVRGGEVIGTVGSTGHVTGSHLHLEVRPGGGDPVDPYAAMQQHGLFRD